MTTASAIAISPYRLYGHMLSSLEERRTAGLTRAAPARYFATPSRRARPQSETSNGQCRAAKGMVMAVTNHPKALDRALFRRFDDILHFEMPDIHQIAELLKTRRGPAARQGVSSSGPAEQALGMSFADVARAANAVLKGALVGRRKRIEEEDVRAVIQELKLASGS